MNCPVCDNETRVLNTAAPDRRRACTVCGHRFTTVEVLKDKHDRELEAVEQVRSLADRLKTTA